MSIYNEIISSGKLFLISGPCVVESEEICLEVAHAVSAICKELDVHYIFKSSYRKANRTKLNSFTGIGDKTALEILRKVREQVGIPVLTDVHTEEEVDLASGYVDVLQIPAFLCRQTDLLVKAGQSGLPVNIKKGQFVGGSSMSYAAEKVASTGNEKIFLTERGNSFGYGDLVVDFRNIAEMKALGYPVILDATHAVQRPSTDQGVSGGKPEYIGVLARAGVAAGVNGLFLETHPNPTQARSDGSNMLPLSEMDQLLRSVVAIRKSLL